MKSIKDIDVKDKKVLVREDFNVPTHNTTITDNSKLKEALPTINYLKEKGAKIILMSDLGHPHGHEIPILRMDSVAEELGKLLDEHIENVDEIIGENTREAISSMIEGEIVLIENLGFSKGEYKNNEMFAQGLASLADIYVDDDYSIISREYASNVGITKFLPSYAGLLLEEKMKDATDKDKTYPAIIALQGDESI